MGDNERGYGTPVEERPGGEQLNRAQVAELVGMPGGDIDTLVYGGWLLHYEGADGDTVIPAAQFVADPENEGGFKLCPNVSMLCPTPAHLDAETCIRRLFEPRDELDGVSIIAYVQARPALDFGAAGPIIEQIYTQ